MSLVTADDADLDRPRTVDDLAYLPDDGNRYELLDGELVVSPAPIPLHQMAVLGISDALRVACPPDLRVFVAPIDYVIDLHTCLQPDVVVMRRSDVDPLKPLSRPALAIVEIISPSSRATDLAKKPPAYARSGADFYWTLDPYDLHFVARRRRGAEYVETATAAGEQRLRLDEPYPVEICPAEITNG
jgi:Uma2 family endonuclease